MKKIYLAGPMKGMPDRNYPAFRKAREALRAEGNFVFCPAELIEKTRGLPSEEENASQAFRRRVLAVDLRWICEHADAIALLPGWRASTGATAEHATAVALGLEVIELGDETVPPSSWRAKVEAEKTQLGRKLTLDELLAMAKEHFMTPAEIETQRQSWSRSCVPEDGSREALRRTR